LQFSRYHLAILAISVVVISAATVAKYTHLAGGIVGSLAVVVLTLVALPWLSDRLVAAPRWVLPFAFVTVTVVLWVAFGVGYHLAHSGAFGLGSDRADALNVALTRLEHGQYPYAATTNLGNKITPLPGALLLAAPFQVVGDAAIQNLLWIPLFALALSGGWRLRVQPTLIWVATVLLSAEVMREYVTGDDLFVSGIYGAVATLCVVRTTGRQRMGWFLTASAFLGVAVCSRPEFLLLIPVVATYVWQVDSARRAALCAVTSVTVAAALAVPFAVADWANFSPVHVLSKVTSSESITPGAVLLGLMTLAITGAALMFFRPSTPARLYAFCAVLLALPAPLAVAQAARGGQGFNAFDLTFAAPSLAFVALAVVARLDASDPVSFGADADSVCAPAE